MKLSKIISEHDALETRGVVPRDHLKRPLIWNRKGEKRIPYRRPSSLSDPLDDKSSLMPWGQGRALIGAANDPSVLLPLQEALKSGVDFDEAEGKALAKKQAAIAFQSGGGNSRADRGTLWHEVLEQIDKGDDPFVPDEYEDYVSAYKKLMADCRRLLDLAIVETELFGVYDDECIAGTMDVLMWVTCDNERKLVIGDKKTSGTLAYSMGKFAMQLHAYSRMVRYDPAAALRGEDAHGLGVGRSPMTPEHVTADGDIGFIFHLPLGKAEAHLVPLDISRGAEGLRLASEVREWRNSWSRKAARPVPLLSAGASS